MEEVKMTQDTPNNPARRNFIKGVIAAGAAVSSASYLFRTSASGQAQSAPGSADRLISLSVNGQERRVDVMKQETLAQTLRYKLGLTGTKLGCDRAECGACTVLIDDAPSYSCSNLAVWMDGRSVTTVEGVATAGTLSPVQQAFISHDAPQCGFCTSGQVMTATGLLKRNSHPTLAEVKTAMAGNLCRCGGYNRYAEAVVAAGGGSTRTSAGGGQ